MKQAEQKKRVKIKKIKTFMCDICKRGYNQKTKYIEHLIGIKHKKRCQELGMKTERINNEKNHKVDKSVKIRKNK